jgi:hypothetical protein
MRVQESRGDELVAEKRRNLKIEKKRQRMRGETPLCGVSGGQANGLWSIMKLRWRMHPALRDGEAVPSDDQIGWPLQRCFLRTCASNM